jgi:phosphopantetheine binding protein
MTMTSQPADLSDAIGAVMGRVLLRDPLAADEDFFDCGGDSLRAIEVLERFFEEERLTERLTGSATTDGLRAALLEACFEDASPAGLAAVCAVYVCAPEAREAS